MPANTTNPTTHRLLSDVRTICSARHRVGETPLWSAAEQALYWVDIEGRSVHRIAWEAMGEHALASAWNLPERVGCIALSNRATLIAAMETGVFEVELGDHASVSLSQLARFDAPESNMRFNDGRCDALGRFWVSSMNRDMSKASTSGGLYCLDETGLQGPLVKDLIVPNGLAFSSDMTRAYLSDSHPSRQCIWAFDVEGTALSNRKLWVDMKPMAGRPDGAAVDSEDCYWICANDGGQVLRFDPSGQLLGAVKIPVAKPSMCAFGGPDLKHLFVTSITPPQPIDGYQQSLDGAVFCIETNIRGRIEPSFSRLPINVH
jgi:sugar lactone lactonase YvrE